RVVLSSSVGAAARFQPDYNGTQPGDPVKAAAVIKVCVPLYFLSVVVDTVVSSRQYSINFVMPTVPPSRYLSASQMALVLPDASPPSGRKSHAYRPLPSVWDGEDAALLEQMLSFYPRHEPEGILDATVGGWRFWKNSR